ncbi:hypothetical protein [Tuberibacillus sp. Marseille-P3662]|uniref:hypothetical protein n=1 Tax=Tuberibacillus sp. Marseille-P3662 TaxID=1965358 RepID=UPI000A1C9EB5|nr:hypothetical protein [Tuberibacillus sp. Marseille-P3662]
MSDRMNIKEPKPFKLVLDEERNFILDMNAYAAIEQEYKKQGLGIDEALDEFMDGSPTAIRLFLWAGLIHEDEDLTVQDIGKMLGPGSMREFAKSVNGVLSQSLPKADDTKN